MTSLDKLPVEILTSIVECLATPPFSDERAVLDSTRRGLSSLARCSRILSTLALPVLWRNLQITPRNWLLPVASQIYCDDQKASWVQNFECRYAFHVWSGEVPETQTLHEWRKLAEKPDDGTVFWPPVRGFIADARLEDSIKAIVQRVTNDQKDQERWMKAVLEDKDIEAVAGLMLAKLPDVRRLHLETPSFQEDADCFLNSAVEAILESRLSTKPMLPKLEHFYYHGTHDKYPDYPDLPLKFCHVPTLTKLYASCIGFGGENESRKCVATLMPGSSSITDIEFDWDSKILASDLRHLFEACREVKRFAYNVGNPWTWVPQQNSVLRTTLLIHINTLQSITLTHGYYEWNDDFEDADSEMTSMSFKTFPVLRHLALALPFLYGQKVCQFDSGQPTLKGRSTLGNSTIADYHRQIIYEALPECIREVEFRDCGDELMGKCLEEGLSFLFEEMRLNDGCPDLEWVRVGVNEQVVLCRDPAQQQVAGANFWQSMEGVKKRAKEEGRVEVVVEVEKDSRLWTAE